MKKVLCVVTNDLVQDARMIRICTTLHTSGYLPVLIGRIKPHSLSFEIDDFQWHRMRCFFSKGPFFYAEFNLRLFFQIWSRKPDIIYAVDVDTLGASIFGGSILGAAVIYDAHEYFSETPELIEKPFKKRIWKWLEKTLIPKTDQAITVSVALAELFEKLYRKTFTVIRNIPDASYENVPSFEERQKGLIYYQGVLNEGRGLEQIIKAMKFLPNMQLCIAGEGDLSEELRNLAAKSQGGSCINFVGWQSQEALFELAKKAWIGINLLDERSLSYKYSLANKTFDYIKAGLPALHMDFPEYNHLIHQYQIGWVTKSLQPEVLAKMLQQIYDHPNAWSVVQQKCVQAAAELNWEKESKRLLEVFENL